MAEVLAVVAVLLGAGVQAITAIGFSLVCAPFLTLALGGGDGVRLANVLALGVNALIVARGERTVDVRQVFLLLVPAAIAIPITAAVIRGVDVDAMAVVTGVLVLVAVVALARGVRVRALTGLRGAAIAGAVSGAMNVTGGVGGPAVASYAVNADWSPREQRPTLAAYFLGINVLSVAARGVPAVSGRLAAGVAAAVVVGLLAGSALSERLDHDTVRRLTLALAAAGGAVVIAAAVV